METKAVEVERVAQVGDILHFSWGYDMTINEFCKVLENTGKTLKCIMVGHKGAFDGFTGEVSADSGKEYGKPFRLLIQHSEYGYSYAGKFPFCGDSKADKMSAHFRLSEPGRSYYENHMD